MPAVVVAVHRLGRACALGGDPHHGPGDDAGEGSGLGSAARDRDRAPRPRAVLPSSVTPAAVPLPNLSSFRLPLLVFYRVRLRPTGGPTKQSVLMLAFRARAGGAFGTAGVSPRWARVRHGGKMSSSVVAKDH